MKGQLLILALIFYGLAWSHELSFSYALKGTDTKDDDFDTIQVGYSF